MSVMAGAAQGKVDSQPTVVALLLAMVALLTDRGVLVLEKATCWCVVLVFGVTGGVLAALVVVVVVLLVLVITLSLFFSFHFARLINSSGRWLFLMETMSASNSLPGAMSTAGASGGALAAAVCE